MANLLIYKITNLVNGKVYIGQTTQNFARRKGEHIYRFKTGERDHKLYLAMRKYGKDSFKFEVLCCALKPEYLDELEISFIKEYNSFNRGYNMTCGGNGVSEETKRKLSEIHKGRDAYWARVYGENHAKSKWFLVQFPSGEQKVIKGLRQFARDHNLPGCFGLNAPSRGYSVIAKLNDHPETEYTQASGNGSSPALLQDQDMILSPKRKLEQLEFSW